MNNINDTIRNNRDFFNSAEPEEGHFKRFASKLEARFGRKRKINIGPYLLRVAVVTLLVTLSSLWTWDNLIRPQNQNMALSDVSPTYKEVESYYIQQVSLMQNEIINIDIGVDGDHKEVLEEEMKNIDESYKQLQKELHANPNDERIINAMIENYQIKLEVMAYILNQLKELRDKSNNNISHEEVTM